MFATVLSKIFGNRNERILKQLNKQIVLINSLEPQYQALSDEQLRAKTDEFRRRLKEGVTLDSLLPEAFAAVRETSKRTLNMRHFDVQLIGGMVLHQGKIAEMRTGEGKTLMATLAAYLNALTGKGVHIITVNDYLAKRDAEWMSPVYSFLGLTVGSIISNMSPAEKQAAYRCDIVYGTNNEFGFDYLRDNMAFSLGDKVQRELNFAIVDEVDSILIDEARTPLIISGQADDSSELYIAINRLIPQLEKSEGKGLPGDYYLDEKTKQAHLTETGHEKVEELLTQAGILEKGASLYDLKHIPLMHHVYAALRAHKLFHRDVDYIVQNDQVVIVDEHTGRIMEGRRWSDGLHQAAEAKEGVTIQNENQTLASITFQNYFRLYHKLSGMTGTADTEAYEFQQIYGLEVVVIPTNVPVVRDDVADQVYLTTNEKFNAILMQIKECLERKQPVLAGTASIETSEFLSGLLEKENIPHQVLNAKFHAKEAQIISEAGRPGAITIATNMAGRGTDIVLGGNLDAQLRALPPDTSAEEIARIRRDWQERHQHVIQNGGLFIIGSERHESRRIDNQLRGRSGRQGDPGSSRFYLSLQDNLMRIFASDRVAAIMQKLGMKDGESIEHPWVTKAIENAQRKVEARNFDMRKQLLEYDDIANEQRKIIYEQRDELLKSHDISDLIEIIREDVVENIINTFVPRDSLEEQWDIQGLEKQLAQDFNLTLSLQEKLEKDETFNQEDLRARIFEEIKALYQQKENVITPAILRDIEKSVMLQSLDFLWREHLSAMDHLRQGIHLRGYAQKNPKQEYKREAFELFSGMLEQLKFNVLSTLMRIEPRLPEEIAAAEALRPTPAHLVFQHPEFNDQLDMSEDIVSQQEQINTSSVPKVGRNENCPCGSGKKYKHCHGKLA